MFSDLRRGKNIEDTQFILRVVLKSGSLDYGMNGIILKIITHHKHLNYVLFAVFTL